MSETPGKTEVSASPQPGTNLWSLTVICAMAWILPGLGHFLLKRPKRALTFMFSILFLFFWGLSLGAKIYHFEAHQPLTFFAMIAQLGMGISYFLTRLISVYAQNHPDSVFYGFAEKFQFGEGALDQLSFEYGNTFAIVAGLLNFLVILDAHDIAVGKKKG